MRKKLNEGRLEDLINQKDLAAFEQAASSIMDDLTSDGFEADDVRDYLIKRIYSSEEKHAGDIADYERERDSELSADQAAMYKEGRSKQKQDEYIYETAGVSQQNKTSKMKKGLINEAFRLQQLAGIAPVNELNEAADQSVLNRLGAFEDENGNTVVSDLVKNEKFIENKLTRAGISFTKEYDRDVHGQKIVIFVIDQAGMNEMFDTDNDQYLGKYSDAYSRITVSNDGVYTAKDPSDEEAVRLADALTALYDEHGENGIDAWQAGAIDIEDFMD